MELPPSQCSSYHFQLAIPLAKEFELCQRFCWYSSAASRDDPRTAARPSRSYWPSRHVTRRAPELAHEAQTCSVLLQIQDPLNAHARPPAVHQQERSRTAEPHRQPPKSLRSGQSALPPGLDQGGSTPRADSWHP